MTSNGAGGGGISYDKHVTGDKIPEEVYLQKVADGKYLTAALTDIATWQSDIATWPNPEFKWAVCAEQLLKYISDPHIPVKQLMHRGKLTSDELNDLVADVIRHMTASQFTRLMRVFGPLFMGASKNSGKFTSGSVVQYISKALGKNSIVFRLKYPYCAFQLMPLGLNVIYKFTYRPLEQDQLLQTFLTSAGDLEWADVMEGIKTRTQQTCHTPPVRIDEREADGATVRELIVGTFIANGYFYIQGGLCPILQ